MHHAKRVRHTQQRAHGPRNGEQQRSDAGIYADTMVSPKSPHHHHSGKQVAILTIIPTRRMRPHRLDQEAHHDKRRRQTDGDQAGIDGLMPSRFGIDVVDSPARRGSKSGRHGTRGAITGGTLSGEEERVQCIMDESHFLFSESVVGHHEGKDRKRVVSPRYP